VCNFMRKLHLYAGLVLPAFILMYFVSGYILVHGPWFANPPLVKVTQEYPLAVSAETSLAQMSIDLQRQFNLRGKRQPPQQLDDGKLRFAYVHPGMFGEALVAADRSTVTVKQETMTWRITLNQMHRLYGYGGGWLYNIWAAIVDLCAASMIVFALTGIYMWYVLTTRHLLGWILLGANVGLALFTIAYLQFAR